LILASFIPVEVSTTKLNHKKKQEKKKGCC